MLVVTESEKTTMHKEGNHNPLVAHHPGKNYTFKVRVYNLPDKFPPRYLYIVEGFFSL